VGNLDQIAPRRRFLSLVPNYVLKELTSSSRDYPFLILTQSTFQLDPKAPSSMEGCLTEDGRLMVNVGRRMGHEGVVVIRNDIVCGLITSFSYEPSATIKKEDCLIVATKVTGDVVVELHADV
jgi:hypothetical protein